MNIFPLKKKNAGFTLIEAVVSIAIFMVVMVVSTTALLSIIAANKQSHQIKSVMDNLNFALDSMARSIRVGTEYECATYNSSSPAPAISSCNAPTFNYKSQYDSNHIIEYLLCPDGSQQICEQDLSQPSAPQEITDPQVSISSLKFYVVGTNANVGVGAVITQPHVNISISGYVLGAHNQPITFNIETSVTQRAPAL